MNPVAIIRRSNAVVANGSRPTYAEAEAEAANHSPDRGNNVRDIENFAQRLLARRCKKASGRLKDSRQDK